MPPKILTSFITKANEQAGKSYTVQVYPGRVALFLAANEQPCDGHFYEPLLGWGDYLTGKLDIHEVPGSHLDILEGDHVDFVAAKLRESLDKSLSS